MSAKFELWGSLVENVRQKKLAENKAKDALVAARKAVAEAETELDVAMLEYRDAKGELIELVLGDLV